MKIIKFFLGISIYFLGYVISLLSFSLSKMPNFSNYGITEAVGIFGILIIGAIVSSLGILYAAEQYLKLRGYH